MLNIQFDNACKLRKLGLKVDAGIWKYHWSWTKKCISSHSKFNKNTQYW